MLDALKAAFSGLWTSIVRTVVPLAVAAIVTWLTNLGLPVDAEFSAAISGALGTLAAVVFYVLVRVGERLAPKLGWLLGSPKQPVYATPEAQPEAEIIVTAVEDQIQARREE